MTVSTTIQIRGKGTFTLPVEFRKKYGFNEGDVFTIIDLGEGALLLTPMITRLDRLGDRIAQILKEENTTVDDLLVALEEERERYYKEQYAQN